MSKEMFNRLSHDWLQEQLRDLADHIVLANRPATMDEMRIRLRDIAVGRPWRDGAFKRAMCKTRTP